MSLQSSLQEVREFHLNAPFPGNKTLSSLAETNESEIVRLHSGAAVFKYLFKYLNAFNGVSVCQAVIVV